MKDKQAKREFKAERKKNKKKIKQAFKGHKGSMTWNQVEKILKD